MSNTTLTDRLNALDTKRNRRRIVTLVVAGSAVMMIFSLLVGQVGPPDPAKTPAPVAAKPTPAPEPVPESLPSARTGQMREVTRPWLACLDSDDVTKARTYALQGDQEATSRFVAAKTLTGHCTWLDAGDQIHVMDTSVNWVKVRRPGETVEFWTPRETLEKKPSR